jgi:NitT/TauT family transport system substrate-binding protein
MPHLRLSALLASIAVGVSSLSLLCMPASAQERKPVKIVTSWFAQADQDDLGKEAGIKISVLQGGPKIQTIPQVASGQADFGIGNADDILLARLRGAPVRAIFAHLDYVPYTLVYHTDPAVKSIADLQGRTFAVNLGFGYWEWTKKQFKLTGTREIPASVAFTSSGFFLIMSSVVKSTVYGR